MEQLLSSELSELVINDLQNKLENEKILTENMLYKVVSYTLNDIKIYRIVYDLLYLNTTDCLIQFDEIIVYNGKTLIYQYSLYEFSVKGNVGLYFINYECDASTLLNPWTLEKHIAKCNT